MTIESKYKFWKDMTIGLIIVIIIVGFIFVSIHIHHRQKIKFLTPMLGRRASLFLEYVDKYDNDWLEELGRIRTESDFDRDCIGKKREEGWYQILPATYRSMIGLVRTIAVNPNDKYEINLIMGNLHFAAMRRYTGDWLKATEAYNIGMGHLRIGKKNSDYLTRYLQSYEFLLQEWNDFIY